MKTQDHIENRVSIFLATPINQNEISEMLSAQLIEHEIYLDQKELEIGVKGVFEDTSRGAFFILQSDEIICGFIYLAYIWTVEYGGKSAWIEEFYIKPNFRNKGIGSTALKYIFDFAKENEILAIDLEVELNHKRVEGLYIRNGFSPYTRSRWYKKLK